MISISHLINNLGYYHYPFKISLKIPLTIILETGTEPNSSLHSIATQFSMVCDGAQRPIACRQAVQPNFGKPEFLPAPTNLNIFFNPTLTNSLKLTTIRCALILNYHKIIHSQSNLLQLIPKIKDSSIIRTLIREPTQNHQPSPITSQFHN